MKALLNQLKMLREIYPNNENILKIYGLACEQGEQVLNLEKELVELRKANAELERSRKDLIEEFAEAECMGDLSKIARNYGYI
jgi:hypothetical protein